MPKKLCLLLCALLLCGSMAMAEEVYYNALGGKYYHLDPECETVNPVFFPLAGFSTGELEDEAYSHLRPCLRCAAEMAAAAAEAETAQSPTPPPEAPLPGSTVVPGKYDLPQDEAVALAAAEMAELVGKSEEELLAMPHRPGLCTLDIRGTQTPVWIVSFFPEERPGVTYAVTINSYSGKVMDARAAHTWEIAEELWQREWGWPSAAAWSPEEKALYAALYEQHPSRILPDEGAIPQEQAFEIALEAVQQQLGVEMAELERSAIDYSYVPGWYAHQPDSCWLILFHPTGGSTTMYQVVLSGASGEVYTCDASEIE